MNKKQKELEEMATKLTGIHPVNDYEYQRMEYEKRGSNPGAGIKKRKELFKAIKRII